MIVVKDVQFLNDTTPNVSSLAGNFTLLRFVHPENAYSLISVTESGIVTDVRPVQSANAPLSISVSESGSETDVNALQL